MASYQDHPPLKVEALRELVEGGSAPFKRAARSYILWCPRCRRQKLYVERTTGASKCFRCGDFKGWANWVLAEVYNRSLRNWKSCCTVSSLLAPSSRTTRSLSRTSGVKRWRKKLS
jgi:hypothetical protein